MHSVMIRVINLDWLTIHCKGVLFRTPTYGYLMNKQAYGTSYFKELWEVVDKEENDMLAKLQADPYSPIIPKDTVLIQYANRYLYRDDLHYKINDSMLALNLEPKNFSRIDIACDFNFFACGLNPMYLIKGFMQNKYIKRGVKKYALEGEQHLTEHAYQYIRFGKRSAGVCMYLYNKSLELDEKQNKEYIREAWREAGLRTDVPVWRLEFSVDPTQLDFSKKETGEVFDINIQKKITQGMLENVFDALVEKYADFRINDNSNRPERMKRLQLFPENCKTTLRISKKINTANAGRMDKIMINKLMNDIEEFRIDPGDDLDHQILQEAAEVYARRKGLQQYLMLRTKLPYKR